MTNADPSEALRRGAAAEPLAKRLGMKAVEVAPGTATVAMTVDEECLNQFRTAHGGVTFSLTDEGFELACKSHGTVAVALNVNVSFVAPAMPGDRLTARANEISRTQRTGTYDIRVTNQRGDLIAVCHALAYRKREPLPFLET